jgi:hypothetical protein
MQPQIGFPPLAGLFGGLFVLIYLACVIAVIICVLRLLGRFVSAHERVAGAVETIARKLDTYGKQI